MVSEKVYNIMQVYMYMHMHVEGIIIISLSAVHTVLFGFFVRGTTGRQFSQSEQSRGHSASAIFTCIIMKLKLMLALSGFAIFHKAKEEQSL